MILRWALEDKGDLDSTHTEIHPLAERRNLLEVSASRKYDKDVKKMWWFKGKNVWGSVSPEYFKETLCSMCPNKINPKGLSLDFFHAPNTTTDRNGIRCQC